MKDKFNIILRPSLLTLLLLTIGYTLFNWLFIKTWKTWEPKEIIIDIAIPIGLAAIFAWLIIRPKLKILSLEAKRGNYRDLYCFVLTAVLAVPMIITQHNLTTATGKLTELNSINDIGKTADTKYYKLKKHFILKDAAGVHTEFNVSGKGNRDFNMNIYIALPIFESEKDTTSNEPKAWIGLDYSKTISNRLEQNEKEASFNKFWNESMEDFAGKNVAEFVYLDRISNSDDREGYIEAIAKNTRYKPNETILLGRNEPFENRNGNKLEWIFGSTVIGSALWLIMLLIPRIDDAQLERIKAGRRDRVAQKEMLEFLSFVKPREGFFVTPILMYINIGIYILMVIAGLGFFDFKGVDLLHWGANYGPMTKEGDWWRLLTCIFLHGGLMHLLANMYGLMFVGIFLEPLLGRAKYIAAYLLTGVIASIASIWWYDATVSVGASGAIFGLYGIFLALLLTKLFPPDFAKSFLLSTAVFVGFNLLMGLGGGIDNAAHIGGLVSGFTVGLLFYPALKRQISSEQAESEFQSSIAQGKN